MAPRPMKPHVASRAVVVVKDRADGETADTARLAAELSTDTFILLIAAGLERVVYHHTFCEVR